jgi:hypothetical protein
MFAGSSAMIFSKKNDFLFIKGRKVGGTSVEIALSTVCGPEDIITKITPIDELDRLQRGGVGAQNYSRHPLRERKYLQRLSAAGREGVGKNPLPHQLYTSHMSLQEFFERFGSRPTQRIFCVERSPYAKIISMAVMAANFGRYSRTGESMSLDLEGIRSAIATQMSRGAEIGICRNSDLYRDPDGRISLRVLRFECLAKEFSDLMSSYGITPPPDLPHAKQGVNSNSIDPHSVFAREALDRINDIFEDDFEAFGYERL